jgi:NADH-quinone oxidoreductase subunit L
VVFATLAVAAFLTAFYTMRQITLTFLGEPRTKEAEHAQETPWTMTLPLVILSVFAIGYGWVGIPEHFPVLGGLVPNWLHEFVGGTLAEHPETVEFNFIPLLTSLVVALGGLGLGYFVYRDVNSTAEDRLQFSFLKNKYYFDEIYSAIFIKPVIWFAERVVYNLMDKGFIDGILHLFGPGTQGIGATIREKFDLPIINRAIGDGSANITYWFGGKMRAVQTGRIQQYLMLALIVFIAIGAVLYFLVLA